MVELSQQEYEEYLKLKKEKESKLDKVETDLANKVSFQLSWVYKIGEESLLVITKKDMRYSGSEYEGYLIGSKTKRIVKLKDGKESRSSVCFYDYLETNVSLNKRIKVEFLLNFHTHEMTMSYENAKMPSIELEQMTLLELFNKIRPEKQV